MFPPLCWPPPVFSLPGGGVFSIENAGEMAFDILRSDASLRRTNPDAMRTSGFVCIRILRRRRAHLRTLIKTSFGFDVPGETFPAVQTANAGSLDIGFALSAADAPAVKPELLFNSKPRKNMETVIEKIISLVVSAGIGGGIGTCLSIALFLRKIKETDAEREADRARIADLESAISDLRENEFSELKSEVKTHIDRDRSQEILAVLNHLTGNINTLSSKIDRSLETNAAQNEKLRAHDLYLENLNKLLVDKWK